MTMDLTLVRPMVAFDLETTGLDVQLDRIVEISCIKLFPDGSRVPQTYRLNPGIPISKEAQAVHGISDADLKDAPSFATVAPGLYTFLQDADLTGFNVEKFDLPLLAAEFKRVGLTFPAPATRIIDSLRIFRRQEPQDLAHAYRFYCNETLVGAHGAQADAEAAANILLAQVKRYDSLPKTVDALHAHCEKGEPDWIDKDGKLRWLNGEAVLGFGKYRQQSLRSLVSDDPGYLRWMMQKDDFPAEVRQMIKEALSGTFATAPAMPAAMV